MESTEPRLLDCRGQLCPQPVIELAKLMRGTKPGETVEVLAEDPAAAHDIPAWCRMRGHVFVGQGENSGCPTFTVRHG